MEIQNITREAVETLLANTTPNPAVTIYAPMHTTASPPHISENQIRLKNLIHKACEKLEKSEENLHFARSLYELLDAVYDDLKFWEAQTPGLLICARPNRTQLFHVPMDTEEYVAIDENFHLAPVLAMLHEDRDFYVLTVTQHMPRLFQGNRYGMHALDVQLPISVQAGLNIDESNQKSENQGSATGPSTNTGWFNGRGGARNPQEEDRVRFFRKVDAIAYNAIDRTLPVILAGIDSEIAEYRTISKLPKVLEEAINGSHSDAKPDDLFEHAWQIIEHEIVHPAREAAIEEYTRLEGANPDRTARDEKSIEEAAEQGRIDKFMAMMGRYTKDSIRDTRVAVDKITFPEPELSRKVNKLALKVWQMSGTVINLLPTEMPHGAPMVARLRY
jgi:hypothetical protein